MLETDDFQIPKRHFSKLKKDLKKDGPWQSAGETIYSKVGTGFLYALVGPKGTGKTQIGCNVLLQAQRVKEFTTMYVKCMDFFLAVKASYKPDAEMAERDVIRFFGRPEVLVIDEFGERGESEWEDRLLTYLIDRRYDAVKDTLIISNQLQPAFEASLGASALSRLNETGGIIPCLWPSFRDA